MQYVYLTINLFTIVFPLVFSFDRKVNYYPKWKAAFSAIIPVALIFIIWDIIFTKYKIWGFNPDYLLGIYFYHLPLEEILFFITVPFAIIFIYEVVKSYFKKPDEVISKIILVILGIALIASGIFNLDKLYTSVAFLFCGSWILLNIFLIKQSNSGYFLLAYLIHLIPFGLINGLLTYLPVVWYNNNETLGIRIGSIPMEDFFYSMLLFLMNINLYEALKKRTKTQ